MNPDRLSRWPLLFAACVICWYGAFAFFPGLFPYVGLSHFGVWFLDSFAILASNDAVVRGLDPYVPNPLDYFNRAHVYSSWWLHLHYLGLTRADNFWVGFVLVVGFLAAGLAFLRPRDGRELLWLLAVVCSPPVLLAVNRANNDLMIFVLLAPVVPCLLSGRPSVRFLAVVFVALAAGLKYYPAAGGLVLLAGVAAPGREVRTRVGIAGLALAGVGLGFVSEHPGFLQLVPNARGLMSFGAENLPLALGLSGGAATAWVLLLAAGIVAGWIRSGILVGWVIAPADRAAWLGFVLGASVLAGCFFTGTSFAYRWVFALWLAPLLWRLPRAAAAPIAVRRLGAVTAALLLVALWADPLLSAALTFFANGAEPAAVARGIGWYISGEQVLTWAFFGCLLAFLTHFTRDGLRGLCGIGVAGSAGSDA